MTAGRLRYTGGVVQIHTWLADPMGASPVFMREVSARMRRPWAFWLILGYTCTLYAAGLFFLFRMAPHVVTGASVDGWLRQVGAVFVLALFALQFVLISLLGPALTCTAFAGERARRTLVFLLLTPLPSRSIVQGKLHFVLFYVVLLQVTTMPLCAIASLFGGFSPIDLAFGYLALASYGVLVGAFGLYVSAQCQRTGRAAAWSYLGMLAMPVLIPYPLALLIGAGAMFGGTHDGALVARLSAEVPIVPLAILTMLVCWPAAQWMLAETTCILDVERHTWGASVPPAPVPAPPAAEPAATVPQGRRW